VLLTVVTPSLNRRATIAKALDSVCAQTCPAVEHLVVDGGSTDGTLEMLAGRPEVRLIVEPDRNLYDAINKGIRAARGGVICLLNTDDWFAPGAFASAMAAFDGDSTLEMASGGVEVVALEPAPVTRGDAPAGLWVEGPTIARQNSPAMKSLRWRDVISGIPAINGRFFRHSVFDRVGEFDLRFPIASDRDFLARVLLAGVRNQVLPDVVYRYGSHPGSLSMAGPAVRRSLSAECFRLARIRCRECAGDPAAHRAYRQWQAWATGYHAGTLALCGELSSAVDVGASLLAEDRTWPLSFLVQAANHWRERGIRR